MSESYPDMTQDVAVTRTMMPEAGALGFCLMQVCAYGEVPLDRVEQRANELNPAAEFSGRWTLCDGTDEDSPFNNANKGPRPCADVPGRMHYLLRI